MLIPEKELRIYKNHFHYPSHQEVLSSVEAVYDNNKCAALEVYKRVMFDNDISPSNVVRLDFDEIETTFSSNYIFMRCFVMGEAEYKEKIKGDNQINFDNDFGCKNAKIMIIELREPLRL